MLNIRTYGPLIADTVRPLDMKCNKLEIRLKQFLRKIVKVVLSEINRTKNTDYQMKDVYFAFSHNVMSNAQENAQIELTEAQKKQVEINIILNLADTLDSDTVLQMICDTLDIDYMELKDKLPKDEEELTTKAQTALDGVVTDE